MITQFSRWYFTDDTTAENRTKYLVFMGVAFVAIMTSFHPALRGHRIGVALYLATFIMDMYLQVKLPVTTRFFMSFAVAAGCLSILAVLIAMDRY